MGKGNDSSRACSARRLSRLRGGGPRAVPLSRRRADRGAARGDPRPPRLLRTLRRCGRVRGRAAPGHRQPVQGPGAPEPDRAGGRGHRRGKPAARRQALSSRRRSPSRTPPAVPAMVDWALAQRVAGGRSLLKPAPATYRSSALQGQFDDLTAQAETLVSEATGLHSRHGSARAKVTDRPGWAAANVRSIAAAGRPGARSSSSRRRGAKLRPGPRSSVGRAVAGTQLGLMLAYMATRVLGQYDLLSTTRRPRTRTWSPTSGPTSWPSSSSTASPPASSGSGWPCTR